ncbi:hypothetical protein VL806_07865 [Listeria seeligeri]|nr:hypothetical protein [Listeria seeligeri]
MVRQIKLMPTELRERARAYVKSGRILEDVFQRLMNLQEQLRFEWKRQVF